MGKGIVCLERALDVSWRAGSVSGAKREQTKVLCPDDTGLLNHRCFPMQSMGGTVFVLSPHVINDRVNAPRAQQSNQ